MSTTSQVPQQPTQQHVDAATNRIQQAARAGSGEGQNNAPAGDRQAQLDRQTQANTQAVADAQRAQQQSRRDNIKAAARQQREAVRARAEEVRQGDMVVVDLERVPRELHTVPMRDSLRRLHQSGAHEMTGRVQRIEDGVGGRQAVVEDVSGTMVQTVPMAAVVRADLYDGVDEESD